MTIAEQIDNYLRTQLEKIHQGQTITMFGGETYTFRTEAGQLVMKNLEYTEHPDDMPSLVFYTGKNSSSVTGDFPAELGMESHLQDVNVEGFIECDKAGTEADDLKTDIAAVIKCDPFLGGLVDLIQDYQSDVAISAGETVYAVVSVKFTAVYQAPYGSE